MSDEILSKVRSPGVRGGTVVLEVRDATDAVVWRRTRFFSDAVSMESLDDAAKLVRRETPA